MTWRPWHHNTRSDEELRRKERDVAEVRHEVNDLVDELQSVLERIEKRVSKGGRNGGAPATGRG